MTFQIGAVARDGILLASDTLCQETESPGQRMTSFNASKITVLAEKEIAYCWAGDSLAKDIAEQVADRISEENFQNLPAFFAGVPASSKAKADWWGGSVLLVLGKPKLQLWRLQINKDKDLLATTPMRILRKFVVIGDPANYGRFYLERYFPEFPKPSLDEIIPLAAHTVLMAGDLNPQNVGGLELLRCRVTGFEQEPEEQLSHLMSTSAKRERPELR